MNIEFKDLSDLAIACFKGGEEDCVRFEKASDEEDRKKDFLLSCLTTGEADLFYLKDKTGKNGKSLLTTWTRSTRAGVAVQETVWLVNELKKTVMSLSHQNINEQNDMGEIKGTVIGVGLNEPLPIDGFTVIP